MKLEKGYKIIVYAIQDLPNPRKQNTLFLSPEKDSISKNRNYFCPHVFATYIKIPLKKQERDLSKMSQFPGVIAPKDNLTHR